METSQTLSARFCFAHIGCVTLLSISTELPRWASNWRVIPQCPAMPRNAPQCPAMPRNAPQCPAMPRNAPLIPTYNCFESVPPNVSKSLLDYATAWRCLRFKDFTRNSVKPICISTGIQVPIGSIGTLWKIKRNESAHRQKVAALFFHWHKAWCSKVTFPLQHLYCTWQGHRLDV